MILMPSCCTSVAGAAVLGDLPACAPYARQTKRSSEIIDVVCRALGGRPGQRLMTTCAADVKIGAVKHTPDCTKVASEPI